MHPDISKGKILISEPFLNDLNFKRTIILLVEHDEEGTLGFILNKPTGYNLNQTLEEFPNMNSPLLYGGPVHVNAIQFIYRGENLIEGSREILPGLFWGGSFETLKILSDSQALNTKDFRFFMGYSGWSKGQLEDEINSNAWIVTETSISNIFSDEPDKLWTEILKSMGKKFAVFASFPENPSVN